MDLPCAFLVSNKCWPIKWPRLCNFHKDILSAKKCPLQPNFRASERINVSVFQIDSF